LKALDANIYGSVMLKEVSQYRRPRKIPENAMKGRNEPNMMSKIQAMKSTAANTSNGPFSYDEAFLGYFCPTY
jgi:hypothetical protein